MLCQSINIPPFRHIHSEVTKESLEIWNHLVEMSETVDRQATSNCWVLSVECVWSGSWWTRKTWRDFVWRQHSEWQCSLAWTAPVTSWWRNWHPSITGTRAIYTPPSHLPPIITASDYSVPLTHYNIGLCVHNSRHDYWYNAHWRPSVLTLWRSNPQVPLTPFPSSFHLFRNSVPPLSSRSGPWNLGNAAPILLG